MVIISLSSFHQKHWFDLFFPIEIPLFHEQPLFHFKLSRAGNLTFWTFQALCSGRRARRGLLGAGNLTFLFFRPRNCVFWLVEAPRSVAAWNHCCGILAVESWLGGIWRLGTWKLLGKQKSWFSIVFYSIWAFDPQFRSRVAHLGVTVYCYLQHFSAAADRRVEPAHTSPALEKP